LTSENEGRGQEVFIELRPLWITEEEIFTKERKDPE
jgi:hypothetical protein